MTSNTYICHIAAPQRAPLYRSVLLMCEECVTCRHRQAIDAGQATSSLFAAQSESKLTFRCVDPALAISRLQPRPTLPPAHHQQEDDVSSVLTLLMFLRVEYSSKFRAVSVTGKGYTIDLTVDAFESGKVWPCTFCSRLAIMLPIFV